MAAPQDGRVKRKRKPSESMIRALGIVARHGPTLYPSKFARLMWATETWQAHAVGKTGGAYLDRLCRMGLITAGGGSLTEAGRKVLDQRF